MRVREMKHNLTESEYGEIYGWENNEITDEDLNAMEKEHYDKIKKQEVKKMSKERNKTIEQSTELQEGQEISRASATFALEGEFVKNMKDRTFEVKAFKTVAKPDLDNPGQLKEKLILTIQLADGVTVEYYPNGTSQKVIINSGRGYAYKDWIGFKGKLITKSQRVGNADKEVIYIEKL